MRTTDDRSDRADRPDGVDRHELVERWGRLSGLPLTVLSLVFLAAYAIPILRPDLGPGWAGSCEIATIVIWLLFWLDFLTRLGLATDRRRFLRGNLFDLAVLLLPFLRPLRAVRLVTVVLTLTRRTESWVRGRLAAYVTATTVLLVVVAALAVLDAERGATGANITDYPEALWWAVVTITTVGYGDHYPVTTEGRFVALGLMIGGIGLIGFVTGSLATWIVAKVADRDQPAPATAEDIRALRAEIVALHRRLDGILGPRPDDATDDRQPESLPTR